MTVPVIAIDGPSGSGKGTVSRRVAAALDWQLLDSGALYRLTGLAGQRRGLDPGDVAGHAALAATMDVSFGSRADGSEQILLGTADVTDAIRSELAGSLASRVAGYAEVRAALMGRQQRFRRLPGLVADGRDMGSVVFPDAALKIFLTATAEERARRRHRQLAEQGQSVDLAEVAREIAARDHRDTTRAVAPLIAAADAVLLDSTALGPPEVVAQVLALARARRLAS